MDYRENINTIKEIFPGHFQIILDFATIDFLNFAISDLYKYVWVYTHKVRHSLEWDSYSLPLLKNVNNENILARNIVFDFCMKTEEFKEILPHLGPGIRLSQMNRLPTYYLNPDSIVGKTRYDLLLNECDYLFEIDIPSATDYGTIVSSDRNYLQSLLDNDSINWGNLP